MEEVDLEIDATGLLCPLPVLRLRKRLAAMPDGATILMLADDPAARIDVPHFCAEAGHVLLSSGMEGKTLSFRIRKGA